MGLSILRRKAATRLGNIATCAEALTQTYLDEFGYERLEEIALDMDELYQSSIYPKYELELVRDQDLGFHGREKVLGQTIPKKRLVFVDRTIATPGRDKRSSFTYGHEFGHGVLHTDQGSLFRSTERDFSNPDIDRLEKEANCFAEHLLMPELLVLLFFKRAFDRFPPIKYRGPGPYTFCAFGKDVTLAINSISDFCLAYAGFLSPRFFSISKSSLALRLWRLKFIQSTVPEKFDFAQPQWWGNALHEDTKR